MVWMVGAGSLLLIVAVIIGLADLVRSRHSMSTAQVVVWAVAIIVVPVIGLIAYLFWRIARSEAMRDSMEFQDEHSGKGEPYPPIGR